MEKVKLTWNKSTMQIARDTMGGEQTLRFMAVTWHRLYNQWVPMDTGTLADNVDYSVEGNMGIIHHKAPYSDRIYHAANMRFRTEKHALASAMWDKAAASAGAKDKLTKDTQAYIKRGLLGGDSK